MCEFCLLLFVVTWDPSRVFGRRNVVKIDNAKTFPMERIFMTLRNLLDLLLLLDLVQAQLCYWDLRSNNTGPVLRSASYMTYRPHSKEIIMYGGRETGIL